MLLSHAAFAESGKQVERKRFNVFTDLSFNSNTVDTKETDSTNEASTAVSFTAIEIGGDYFLTPKLAVSAQFLIKLQSSVDTGIKGFDVGARYYPFNPGHSSDLELLNSKIETSPGITTFVYGGFSNREYQLTSSNISFSGLEVGGGLDYHLNQRSFIRGSANYQMLQNTSSRSLSGFNASIGYGYSF